MDDNRFDGQRSECATISVISSDAPIQIESAPKIASVWLSVITVGLSNFSIQYNFGSIAIALLMMSTAVCTQDDIDLCRKGIQQSWVQGTSSSVVFLGAVLGQLVMGSLGDIIGRSQALLVTMSIATGAAALQALAPAGSPRDIYTIIIIFRFFLGVGVGGIYPLSAIKAVEDSAAEENKSSSNDSMKYSKKAVASGKGFFWQIPGMMAPYVVSYILTFSILSIDTQWRLTLGLGAIPSGLAVLCLAMEFRLMRRQQSLVIKTNVSDVIADCRNRNLSLDIIPSPHCENSVINIERGTQQPVVSKPSLNNIMSLIFRNPTIQRKLLATGMCWFLFDVVNYGIGLIAPEILAEITHDIGDITSKASIRKLSSLTLSTMALSIPGIFVTIAFLPRFGIKWMQVVGFAITGCFCLLLGICFQPMRDDVQGLFAIYCLLSVAMSIGTGISTYTMPALLFESNVRATFNGISAAMGKVGAVLGSYSFGIIARSSSYGYTIVMVLCFVLSAVSSILSQLCIDLPPHQPNVSQNNSEPSSSNDAKEKRSSEIEIRNIIHSRDGTLS